MQSCKDVSSAAATNTSNADMNTVTANTAPRTHFLLRWAAIRRLSPSASCSARVSAVASPSRSLSSLSSSSDVNTSSLARLRFCWSKMRWHSCVNSNCRSAADDRCPRANWLPDSVASASSVDFWRTMSITCHLHNQGTHGEGCDEPPTHQRRRTHAEWYTPAHGHQTSVRGHGHHSIHVRTGPWS